MLNADTRRYQLKKEQLTPEVEKVLESELTNIKPTWDAKQESYVLPFFGRVKLASAKNFQLIADGDKDNILLLFGKVKKDHFSLDFRHPLTLLDAFGIAIASLSKKRAVS